MKYKRKFKGKVGQSLILFVVFWAIVHFCGWYSNGFEGFLNLNLARITLSVSILLGLLTSNSGKSSNEYYELLPFINSYKIKEEEYRFSPGGFNLLARSLYFCIALFLLSMSFYLTREEIGYIDYSITVLIILVLGLMVWKYLKNRNDFLLINNENIQWFDKEFSQEIILKLNEIQSYEVENESYKSLDYPLKIIINANNVQYTIDLKEMSILQYSAVIIEQLKIKVDSFKK
jgi:hypothetical protein